MFLQRPLEVSGRGANDGGRMTFDTYAKMNNISLTVLLLTSMNLHSAGMLEVLECHDQVVRHGVEKLIFPKEVESIIGATNVDHFISEFGSGTLPSMWNSVGYFNNRYRFSLYVPIWIDYDKCKLIVSV